MLSFGSGKRVAAKDPCAAISDGQRSFGILAERTLVAVMPKPTGRHHHRPRSAPGTFTKRGPMPVGHSAALSAAPALEPRVERLLAPRAERLLAPRVERLLARADRARAAAEAATATET